MQVPLVLNFGWRTTRFSGWWMTIIYEFTEPHQDCIILQLRLLLNEMPPTRDSKFPTLGTCPSNKQEHHRYD